MKISGLAIKARHLERVDRELCLDRHRPWPSGAVQPSGRPNLEVQTIDWLKHQFTEVTLCIGSRALSNSPRLPLRCCLRCL